jgi:putative transposase
MNDKDRLRFIHDLFVFNDANSTPNYILPRRHESYRRELLVHIHAWCLMGNHYHLLLSEARENGISLFMQKLNMGYAKYFNKKYDRTGSLWQGKYKKILVTKDSHFLHIPYYIHLNPLDFSMQEWRDGQVKQPRKALEYLSTFRWSSHMDYIGKRNFPSIIRRDLLADVLGNIKKYERELVDIMTHATLANQSNTIEN